MTSRKHLTLKDKIELINIHAREKCSVRDLAARFKIGKTQVSDTLKKKDKLLEQFSYHGNDQVQKSFPNTVGLQIDQVTYEWFCRARACKIPINGPMIRGKALEVAKALGENEFKASVGWLDKFKSRHNISWKTVKCKVESIDTKDETDWTSELGDLCRGFQAKDIYNCYETVLFFRALPEETTSLKYKRCQGGKISRDCLTVMLCSNMLGDFERPLVIGRSQNAHCFKDINLNLLNVDWKYNKRAWMTPEIMSEWLNYFNKKMIHQNRNIILFMDEAASHPPIELSNIQLEFLPLNTTVGCQPLDQAIIQNFEVQYRKNVLRHLIANMDDMTFASDIAKKISVMDAVQWISSSVEEIKKRTILNCIVKSGFQNTALESNIKDKQQEDQELQHLLITYNTLATSDSSYKVIDLNVATEYGALYTNDTSRIIQVHSHEDEEMEDCHPLEDDNNEPPMKLGEVLLQINRLKRFFTNESDNEGLSLISSLQANVESKIISQKVKR